MKIGFRFDRLKKLRHILDVVEKPQWIGYNGKKFNY